MPRTHKAYAYADGALYGTTNHTQYYQLPYLFRPEQIRGMYNTLAHNISGGIFRAGDPGLVANPNISQHGVQINQYLSAAGQATYTATEDLPFLARSSPTAQLGSQFTGPSTQVGGGYLLIQKVVDRFTFINHSNAVEKVEFYFVTGKGWRDGSYSYAKSTADSTTGATGMNVQNIEDNPINFNYYGLTEEYGAAVAGYQTPSATAPNVQYGTTTPNIGGGINLGGDVIVAPPNAFPGFQPLPAGADDNKKAPFLRIAYAADGSQSSNATALQTPIGIPFGKNLLFRRHWKVYACKRFIVGPGKHINITMTWKKPFKWPMNKITGTSEYGNTTAVLGAKQKRLIVAMTGHTYPGKASEDTTGTGFTALNYTRNTYVSYSHEPDNYGNTFGISNLYSLASTDVPIIPAKAVTQTVTGANEVDENN